MMGSRLVLTQRLEMVLQVAVLPFVVFIFAQIRILDRGRNRQLILHRSAVEELGKLADETILFVKPDTPEWSQHRYFLPRLQVPQLAAVAQGNGKVLAVGRKLCGTRRRQRAQRQR